MSSNTNLIICLKNAMILKKDRIFVNYSIDNIAILFQIAKTGQIDGYRVCGIGKKSICILLKKDSIQGLGRVSNNKPKTFDKQTIRWKPKGHTFSNFVFDKGKNLKSCLFSIA